MDQWIIALIMMSAYLVFALWLGIAAGRGRSHFSVEEFTVAHRGMSGFLMFFLMGGTIFSAFAFLGGPGWAYSRGAAAFFILSYASMGLLPWFVIGPKVGRIGAKFKLTTIGAFLRLRYESKWLPVLVGLISLFAFIQYLALQLKGMAYVFNVLTDGHIAIWAGALISYGIVIIYVATGGVRAAAWSDVLQALLMYAVAWGVGLYLAFHLYGGPGAMFEKVIELKPGLLEIGREGSKMSPMAFSTAILVSVLGFIMWPHLFMKSFTTDANTVRRTAVAYPVFAIFLVPVLFIGFAGIGAVNASELKSSDEILPYLIAHVLNAPGWLYGLIGAGALAAAMSSADAITHGAAVEVIEDVWRTFRPATPERSVVWLMRWAVVVVGAIAYYVAIFGAAGLVKLLLGAYGSIVQFAPATYGALYWRRSTRAGALAGLVTGVAVNIWFQFHPPTPLGIHAGILGLIANLIVFVVVSLATAPSPEPVVRAFTQPE